MSLLLIPDIEVGEKQPRMPGEVLRFLPNWCMLCLHLLLKKEINWMGQASVACQLHNSL